MLLIPNKSRSRSHFVETLAAAQSVEVLGRSLSPGLSKSEGELSTEIHMR